jgi:phage-related protein
MPVSALRNMLVRVGADITGLRQGLRNAQKDVAFFGRNVTGSLKEIQGQIAGAGAALGGGLLIKSGIQDAMRYEALMTTLGESMGESRKEFEKWQEQVGQSMGFSRLQGAETANMLSLNFKKIATDQEDLVRKTTKMMEVAAVVANKRGMTMQEVSDRIRSAMNQEADGADELGVNVRQAALEQTQAYKELAEGQPFDKLSESIRKTILYNAILEQVSQNLGTTLQDTTAMRMAVFTAALADVRMALGQAFLPILYNVLPILTKLANALYKVLQVIAAFMRSLFGGFKYKPPVTSGDVKTTNEQAKAMEGVGKAAEGAGKKSSKAAKKAKEAWKGLFGFDEVHNIKENADAAANAAGGAGDAAKDAGLGGLGDEAIAMPTGDFSGLEEGLDELAGKMDKYTKPIRDAFKVVAAYVREKIAEMRKWWREHGDTITKAFKAVSGVVGAIIRTLGKFIWDSITMVVDGLLKVFRGFITFFSGVFTGDWKAAIEGLQDIFFGALEALMGFWNLSFIGGLRKLLWEFAEAGIKRLVTFATDFKGVFSKGLTDVKGYWDKLFSGVKQILTEMKAFIDGKVELMQTSFKKFWDNVSNWAKKSADALKSIWGGIKEWFARTVINPIVSEMERIKDAFSKGIGEGFVYLINRAIDGFNNALAGFNRLKNATPFGKEIPDLKIPHLARGGITNGPTLAVVGDNFGGREVISPLDRLQGMLTTSVVQAMQMTGGNQTATGDIILNIDGRSFARIVKPLLDKEQNRVGSDVRIRTI